MLLRLWLCMYLLIYLFIYNYLWHWWCPVTTKLQLVYDFHQLFNVLWRLMMWIAKCLQSYHLSLCYWLFSITWFIFSLGFLSLSAVVCCCSMYAGVYSFLLHSLVFNQLVQCSAPTWKNVFRWKLHFFQNLLSILLRILYDYCERLSALLLHIL